MSSPSEQQQPNGGAEAGEDREHGNDATKKRKSPDDDTANKEASGSGGADNDMEEELPEGWIIRESKSRPGKRFYYNTVTRVAQWSAPQAPAKAQKKEHEPSKVRCKHILIKHSKSRNPSSWREPKITMSKDEAKKILYELRRQIIKNEKTFESIAKERSDCSSAKREGDLGEFPRGKMQKPFEEAAFGLEVDEVSGVVDTDSGLHIIKRVK